MDDSFVIVEAGTPEKEHHKGPSRVGPFYFSFQHQEVFTIGKEESDDDGPCVRTVSSWEWPEREHAQKALHQAKWPAWFEGHHAMRVHSEMRVVYDGLGCRLYNNTVTVGDLRKYMLDNYGPDKKLRADVHLSKLIRDISRDLHSMGLPEAAEYLCGSGPDALAVVPIEGPQEPVTFDRWVNGLGEPVGFKRLGDA